MIPRHGLGTRLIVLLSVALVLTFGTFAWVTAGIQRTQFEEDAERFAITTSDLIRNSIGKQMPSSPPTTSTGRRISTTPSTPPPVGPRCG